MVGEAFGRTDLAIANAIHGFTIITVLDVFLDELPELLGVVAQKGRGLLGVVGVEGGVDNLWIFAVVEIGTRAKVDGILA